MILYKSLQLNRTDGDATSTKGTWYAVVWSGANLFRKRSLIKSS